MPFRPRLAPMKRGFLVLAAAALPLAALAQTYKWKDEHGQVHFTQVPPKSGRYEVIGAPPPPASAPNQEALNKALDESVKAEPERQKAATEAAQQLAQRQENCKQALERLAYLDARTPRRLSYTDAQGNVTRMSDEEFQKRRAAAQEKIQQNCD